jgi:hypothetical protein
MTWIIWDCCWDCFLQACTLGGPLSTCIAGGPQISPGISFAISLLFTPLRHGAEHSTACDTR